MCPNWIFRIATAEGGGVQGMATKRLGLFLVMLAMLGSTVEAAPKLYAVLRLPKGVVLEKPLKVALRGPTGIKTVVFDAPPYEVSIPFVPLEIELLEPAPSADGPGPGYGVLNSAGKAFALPRKPSFAVEPGASTLVVLRPKGVVGEALRLNEEAGTEASAAAFAVLRSGGSWADMLLTLKEADRARFLRVATYGCRCFLDFVHKRARNSDCDLFIQACEYQAAQLQKLGAAGLPADLRRVVGEERAWVASQAALGRAWQEDLREAAGRRRSG